MAWIMDTISMVHGHTELGVVTGKPLALRRSQGRHEADGARRAHTLCVRRAKSGVRVSAMRAVVVQEGLATPVRSSRVWWRKTAPGCVAACDSKCGILCGKWIGYSSRA
jgi:glutamate dehydrogenase (NAD(P)+)